MSDETIARFWFEHPGWATLDMVLVFVFAIIMFGVVFGGRSTTKK